MGWLVTFICIQLNSSAQTQLPPALLNYYNTINKAELAYFESNYELAISLYDSAFALRKSNFACDLFSAAVCNAFLKKYKNCTALLQLVLDKGYHINNIKKQPVFNSYLKSEEGEILLKYSKNGIKKYNVELRKTIDSLVYMDQLFRSKEGKYDVYGDTIHKIDSLNSLMLTALIKQYGFPDEDLIGVPDSSLHSQPFEVLIVHQQKGARNSFFDYTEILNNALSAGKIKPMNAAFLLIGSTAKDPCGLETVGLIQYILDSIANKTIGHTTPELHYEKEPYGFLPLTAEEEAKYDRSRKAMGIDNVSDYRKKLVFQMHNSLFALTFMGRTSGYVLSDEKLYKKLKGRLILVK